MQLAGRRVELHGITFAEFPLQHAHRQRIEQVIGDLVEHGLATSVVSTVPVVTYKTADLGQPRGRRDNRRRRN